MTYLLQLKTNDFGLQLKTEVVADDIQQLQYESSKMVKENPSVKGMEYRIFTYTKNGNKFISKFIKKGIISK